MIEQRPPKAGSTERHATEREATERLGAGGVASEPAEPEPAEPEDVGVQPETPEQMQVEAARLLANDARELLRDRGFGDRQIDRWANTYVADHGSGDLDTFLAWIAHEERTS